MHFIDHLRLIAVSATVCASVGGLLAWISGLPFWAAALIVGVAMLANGLIAEIEDGSPGGFNDPKDGRETTHPEK
ncbi:hypothetical protein [Roseateles chitosanitabidus]|uniref:hypothetical protein n=1 Tax=Roseateles chitosanitabidus TaxID=65048 RepID=UPI0011E03B35|nr:hypothetical protein [Roseateles chitosanitabidus]